MSEIYFYNCCFPGIVNPFFIINNVLCDNSNIYHVLLCFFTVSISLKSFFSAAADFFLLLFIFLCLSSWLIALSPYVSNSVTLSEGENKSIKFIPKISFLMCLFVCRFYADFCFQPSTFLIPPLQYSHNDCSPCTRYFNELLHLFFYLSFTLFLI